MQHRVVAIGLRACDRLRLAPLQRARVGDRGELFAEVDDRITLSRRLRED
jgi:hypothetical protein